MEVAGKPARQGAGGPVDAFRCSRSGSAMAIRGRHVRWFQEDRAGDGSRGGAGRGVGDGGEGGDGRRWDVVNRVESIKFVNSGQRRRRNPVVADEHFTKKR